MKGSLGNNAIGADRVSVDSLVGLAIALRSIASGGGVGGRDMMNVSGVLLLVLYGRVDEFGLKNDEERVCIPLRSEVMRFQPF